MPGVRHRVLRLTSTPVVVLVVLGVNLLQSPGRATFDTKLDLLLNPGGFLHRALSMWNSSAAFGGVQNQAYGFLFPMGSWFWLTDVIGIPVWISERLWSSLLLIVAYAGMHRLARVWGLTGAPAVLAGLAYMLAPRMLTTVGVLSGEVVPSAVLPWTMLPLLLHLRGRLGASRAAVLSAATVPFMGGHNATEVLASLAAPALLLFLAQRGPRWRLGAGWLGLVALASLWWLVPLLLLGRYSPPFLDYIESASTTTSNIGWLAALRGTTHWVAYLGDALTGWTAGFELASSPILLVVTTLAAGIGLLGLLRRELPERRALMGCLLLGLVVMTMGSADIAGSPLRESWRGLLDGPLAPFRNIHKFDPVVRLPLALGFGMAVASVGEWLGVWWRERQPFTTVVRPSTVVAGIAGAVLLVTAQPALAGHLRDARPYDAIPSYWRQAASYLQKLPPDSRVLVLPGSSFAVQTWGRTQDEILQAFDVVPTAVRNQVPISSPGLIRTLDTIEDALVGGRPSPGLSDLLRRVGVTHLVVRNDLDPAVSDAPSPSSVHAMLGGSSGLSLRRAFGSAGNGFPGVEVFAVSGDTSGMSLTPIDDAIGLTGGPDALMSALETGALPQTAATVTGLPERPQLIADTYRRVERTFGRVHQPATASMTEAEPFRLDRPVHDYGLVGEPLTEASYHDDITAVTASSSSGYADTFGAVQPGNGPQAALDGDVFTAWRSAPFTRPEGQWIEVDLREPRRLLTLSLVFDPRLGVDVSRVRIDVDSGSVSAAIDDEGRSELVTLPSGATHHLRVTVVGVRDEAPRPVVLAEIGVPALQPARRLDVPAPLGPQDTLLLTSPPAARVCLPQPNGVACDAGRTVAPEEDGDLRRRIEVLAGGHWVLSGSVVAGTGNQVARLFDPLSNRQVRVVGSSSYGGDPVAGAWHALDNDPGTTWISGIGDPRPALDLSWGPLRTLSRIHVATFSGRSPSTVTIEGGGRKQTVQVGPSGLGLISPIRTRHLRVTFAGPDGKKVPGPISVAELRIEGLEGLHYQPLPQTPTGTPCGFGPQVVVAGHPVPTRVVGTLGDVEAGRPLHLESCARTVEIAAGPAEISVTGAGGFVVTALTLRPLTSPVAELSSGSAEVTGTSAASRSIRVRTDTTSILALPLDANDGWRATLAGRSLPAVTVDGWRQGWIVPVDSQGTIRMTFGPQRWYVAGLLLGGLLVALVWGAALIMVLRRRDPSSRQARAAPAPEVSAPAIPLLRRRSRHVVVVSVVTLAAVLVSPPLAVGIALGSASRVTRTQVRWFAAALVAVAAFAACLTIHDSLRAPAVADVLVAMALGAVTAVGWRVASPLSGPHEEAGA